MSLEKLAGIIWAAGAVIFVLVRLVGYWRFRLKLRRSLVPDGFYCGVRIFRCEALETPMLTGFFRPAILLTGKEYSPEEREMICRHEYVHFRRKDLWYKLLLVLANGMHWFNPLVYIMVRRAARDMEYSCDEAVVKGKDMDFRRMYSMTILKTMKNRSE